MPAARVLLLSLAALCITGCAKTVVYSQQLAVSSSETAVADFEAKVAYRCPWGNNCGDTGFYPLRLTVRLSGVPELRNVHWTGSDYAPVFLGRIDNELYLVLFANSCYGESSGKLSPHPVFRWEGGHWRRVPYSTIPLGTKANIPRLPPHPGMNGKRYSLADVAAILQDSRESIYYRAWADLDFDKWYGLLFSQCAGPHDLY